MDIFSGVNNISKKMNLSQTKQQIDIKNIQKSQEIQKSDENFNKKSKEEIKKELQKVIEELNKAMNPLNKDLKFQFNDKVDELIVKVVDIKTDRVIREFPPEEALKLMEKMRELVGMLFDKKG